MFKLVQNLPSFQRDEHGAEVPRSFAEEVELAQSQCECGKLRLLVDEARDYIWDREGMRLAGEAQFKLRALNDACRTFERLVAAAPDDRHANQRLATIYQRQAAGVRASRKADLLTRSDQAINRVLASKPGTADRVEAYCLLASNFKSRWIEEFSAVAPDQHEAAALKSPYFSKMLGTYLKATNLDLNARYPATNALALLRIQAALAHAFPTLWRRHFPDATRAALALDNAQRLGDHLTSTLHLALELDEIMGRREGQPDPWAANSRADFVLLTSWHDPDRVEAAYAEAFQQANHFTLEAARRTLQTYQDLGQFAPGVSVALKVVECAVDASAHGRPAPQKVILFTGHMVDAPTRPKDKQRFPATKEAEATARELIKAAVMDELHDDPAEVLGIAGGACGGDILFHEICAEYGIDTALYLALPEEEFKKESVQHGGGRWVARYSALIKRMSPLILQPHKPAPRWLAGKNSYDIWQRNNRWMIEGANASGARERTLIDLLNRERDANGPGGTTHMVELASEAGFHVVELDARPLLASGG